MSRERTSVVTAFTLSQGRATTIPPGVFPRASVRSQELHAPTPSFMRAISFCCRRGADMTLMGVSVQALLGPTDP